MNAITEIEKPPVRSGRRPGTPNVYSWKTMDVGESIVMPVANRKAAHRLTAGARSAYGYRFAMMPLTDGSGVRVTRIE